MLYKDMLLKLEYHRKYIINAFIKKGYFPNTEEINNKLEQIDNRLALFKSYKFIPGEKFNTKQINHMFNMLYKDIVFLYKILEDIQINELNKMLLDIEAKMINLESLATHYKKRANEEINSTALGKTIIFKTDSWNIDVNDEYVSIDIGEIELTQGTEIACFANINNTDKKNIVFNFKASNSKYDFTALPYNYNNDTYIVPGTIEVKDTDLTLNEEFNINSEIRIPYETNIANDYKILGGKGKMVITNKETNVVSIEDIPTFEKPFVATSNCFISFYVEGEETIEYNFNKKPFHSNFSIQNGYINITNDIQKIFLDVEKDFTCYFTFNDKCIEWATLEEAIVYNKYLIYNGMLLVRDFKIKEYIKDKTTSYNVTISINEADNDQVIDSVYIKEVE